MNFYSLFLLLVIGIAYVNCKYYLVFFFFEDDSPLTLSNAKEKFLKRSQKLNEPPHEIYYARG